jgi:hypothetical protein
MNEAANAYAEAIYDRMDAVAVLVMFDHTIVVAGRPTPCATRYQNSAAMRRGLSAGEAQPGVFQLLAIQPGDELDEDIDDLDDLDTLNDNVRR